MHRYVSEPLAMPPKPWERADLTFEGVEHQGASFVCDVFLDRPDADEGTERTPENGYATSFSVFAHGDCWGDLGHCDVPAGTQGPFDRRAPHPLTPYSINIEITDALERLHEDKGELTVTVLSFEADPDVEERELIFRFRRLSLLTYE